MNDFTYSPPHLPTCSSALQDKAPHVTMTVIGIYEALSDHLGAEYISSSILPTIQPFLMDRTLDVEQVCACVCMGIGRRLCTVCVLCVSRVCSVY